jgi:hypothetical protein
MVRLHRRHQWAKRWCTVKRIALSQQGKHKGKFFALVSDADFARVNLHRWTAHIDKHTVYAYRRGRARYKLYLHCFLLGCKGVDHRDGNGLNNTRHNLRKANTSQNGCNSNLARGTSGVRGVAWDSLAKSWYAQVFLMGRRVYFKRCTTLDAAKSARLAAVKKYHKQFARKG